jgi:hypothetical protein
VTDGAARDGIEVEALLTDQYLDSLLAARDRRAIDVPADPRLDPSIRLVARRLDSDLARVHPSFRFEERLAAELARRASLVRAGRGAGDVAVMPILSARPEPSLMPVAASPDAARVSRSRAWPRPQLQVGPVGDSIGLPHLDRSMPRPLLIGGALTSAAISIAGAWVAWRRGRPPVAPMARAVRAAHRTGAARGLGLPLDRARRVGARRLASR